MKKNLFEMGADFSDSWESDNKNKPSKKQNDACDKILPPPKHMLHFAKEKRRGKVVTLVKPFCLTTNDLNALLKSVKKKLGTGGTVRENTLEFQGALSGKLKEILEKMEYRFKN